MILNKLDSKALCVYSVLDHPRVLEGFWAILNWTVFLLPHRGFQSLFQFVGPLWGLVL